MDKEKERYQHLLDRHAARVDTYKAQGANPRATEHSMAPGEIDIAAHLATVKDFRRSLGQGRSQTHGSAQRIKQSQGNDQG
jgi:hypothetical protein